MNYLSNIVETDQKLCCETGSFPFVLHNCPKSVSLHSSGDVYEYCQSMMNFPKEIYRVLLINDKNRLIHDEIIAIGTINSCSLYKKEVFRKAIEVNASGIIVVSNHPSGDPYPSETETSIADDLRNSGEALGIPVIDNIIIGFHCHAVI
ncbi:MAG: hypothetical protein JXR48_18130 [Candidatus Delongbacteria bacterium]|nr:hypothetical protein [Candidatus Delongbacteria bacterium]MBN2836879.1 hypothetical protein [Candidatus Delongbacteria bacterium]